MTSIRDQQLADAQRDFAHATTMPPFCYSSPDWYEKEIESIFRKEWICVGREEQVPSAGDYFRFDIVGEPLVIVRDGKGKLHAHSPLCRHRGTMLAEGSGKCRSFVCPYHSWTYALSGELVAVPGSPDPMAGADGFDPKDYNLLSHRLESWEGFIFVNFDKEAAPLSDWLGDLQTKFTNYNLSQMCRVRSFEKKIACNWKVYFENSMENYHVATVHAKHPGATTTNAEFPEVDGPYFPLFVPAGITAFGGLPTIPTLSDREAKGTYHLLVQPNLQLILTPTYLYYRQYLPDGPDRLTLVHNWCFPADTVALPEFETTAQEFYDKYDVVVQEDMEIAPIVHEGLKAPNCLPGRFADQEILIHRFAKYVIGKVKSVG